MSATIEAILAACRISDVWQALGGPKLRGTRGPAFWRGGNGYNVALDDSKGAWFDFVCNEGGGVLDLVVRVRGGSRQDALRWLADFTGVPLDDTPLSSEDRERWAEERRSFERDLPEARYWRRAAIDMTEELLVVLKSAFFDPTVNEKPSCEELQYLTQWLDRLRSMSESLLVDTYLSWVATKQGLTVAMVRAAKARERTEHRALLTYLRLTDPERTAA